MNLASIKARSEKWRTGRRLVRLTNASQAAHDREWLLEHMPPEGSITLAPGDTSPVAQLVRAAVEVAQARTLPRGCLELAQLIEACDPVEGDPAVMEWVKVKNG